MGSGPNIEESVVSQHKDQFVNLERRRDHEVNQTPSVHTGYTSTSHSRTRSHVSHGEETWSLKSKIDHLNRKLHHKQWEASPFSSRTTSNGDGSYRPRSRTPPNESFSLSSQLDKDEQYHRKNNKNLTPRSMGNDAMSKALRKISKSPFTRRIDKAELPRWFT